jgi:CheY-like chemotaxis protein
MKVVNAKKPASCAAHAQHEKHSSNTHCCCAVKHSGSQNNVAHNLTILLAEDDESYALVLEKAIKALGWANPIRILSNGKEVTNYLGGEGKYADRNTYPLPSVLFLDVKMPLATGFDVLRWMREHPRSSVIPTIMLSSSDDEQDVQLAYDLGANGYFVKPSKMDDLKSMLRAAYEFWTWSAKPRRAGGGRK